MKVSRHVVMSRLLIIVNRMCKREAKKKWNHRFQGCILFDRKIQ